MPSILYRKAETCGFGGKSGSFPEKICRDISQKSKRIIKLKRYFAKEGLCAPYREDPHRAEGPW
jgi:hypothetical protein